MLPKKIVTRVIPRIMENVWKRTKVIIKMKRNKGCEKDYDMEKRGEERRGKERRRDETRRDETRRDETRVCSGTGKDEKRLSKFYGVSSGRGTHYIFLSISGRDWPFRFMS